MLLLLVVWILKDIKVLLLNHVFDHRHGGQVWEKAGMFEQDQLLRHKTKSRIHKGLEITFAYANLRQILLDKTV